MTLAEYQTRARETAIYPESHQIVYPALGLCGEAGEVANVVQKAMRDDELTDEMQASLRKEMGDALWFLAALASDLEWSLEDVAAENLAKLAGRRERGTLGGSGDER